MDVIKHAWLVIAHNEFGVLQRLITMLDSEKCDFYVHIDRKVSQLPELTVKKGRLVMMEDRLDVRWGSMSQIQCELALFEAAAAGGPYDFYHIISGVTLPLKPFCLLDAFFREASGHCILTGLCKDDPYQETLKMRRYNFFLRDFKSSVPFRKRLSQFLWKSGVAIQRIFHIQANRGRVFYKASNWLSLPQGAVEYLLSCKKEIRRVYRYTLCGDEYFVPSTLMDSPWKDTIVNSDIYLKREILRDTATSYDLSELPALEATPYLLARKFTEKMNNN